MSIILGLNCFHTDTAACIIKNGKLEFAIEEERLNREKHTSKLPVLSIQECLVQTKTVAKEITHIAFNTNPNSNFYKKIKFLIKNFSFRNNFTQRYKNKKNLDNVFLEKFNFSKNVKFIFVEHHLAHIASGFYASDFDDAIGLSIDGSGDFVSLMIAECSKKRGIKIKERVNFPDSLGIFYHAMTQFIGFENFGDEYKLMGLASYGKPIFYETLKKNLFLESNDYFRLNLKYFNHANINFDYSFSNSINVPKIYSDKLNILFNEVIKKENTDIFRQDFAASVQKVYEFFFKKILHSLIDNKFSDNLVFAGGCALNSTANNILINTGFSKKIFVPVAPGDNGGCLGAAFYICKEYRKDNNFNNPYIGTSFSNNQIKNIIQEKYSNKIIYKYFEKDEDKYNLASNIIIKEGIIGWFQDRMEFGPRALGNRSILADPRNPNIKEIINTKIKRRESFRPFAPSILSTMQSEWYEESFQNPYMSAVMKPKKNKVHLIPGVVHVDRTSRVQTVFENTNKTFFNLIYTFYLKTKVPILLNTSFNENEPIVRKPEEAIDCLLRTNMDALFINDFFIKRK